MYEITSYKWYVNGILRGQSRDFSYQFTEAGSNEIRLVITDDSEDLDERNVEITINSMTPIIYNWDFGEGQLSANQNQIFTFQSVQSNPVKLTVTASFSGVVDESSSYAEITLYQAYFDFGDKAKSYQQYIDGLLVQHIYTKEKKCEPSFREYDQTIWTISPEFINVRGITTMSLIFGQTEVFITHPEYGYITEIKMPIYRKKNGPGKGYIQWAASSTYDIRICKCKLILDLSDHAAMLIAYNVMGSGRYHDCTLRLQNNSGFFPAGPDRGDTGDLTIKLLLSPGGALPEPYMHFETEATMIFINYPSYSLPQEFSENGDMQIGPVAGIRFPPDWIEPSSDYSIAGSVNWGRNATAVDFHSTADDFLTQFSVVTNQSKAAALSNFITGSSCRANDFTIITQANCYLFGYQKNSSGTYSCQLLNDILEIEHLNFNEFRIPLKLGFRTVS